jgi:hypothetical protein
MAPRLILSKAQKSAGAHSPNHADNRMSNFNMNSFYFWLAIGLVGLIYGFASRRKNKRSESGIPNTRDRESNWLTSAIQKIGSPFEFILLVLVILFLWSNGTFADPNSVHILFILLWIAIPIALVLLVMVVIGRSVGKRDSDEE